MLAWATILAHAVVRVLNWCSFCLPTLHNPWLVRRGVMMLWDGRGEEGVCSSGLCSVDAYFFCATDTKLDMTPMQATNGLSFKESSYKVETTGGGERGRERGGVRG